MLIPQKLSRSLAQRVTSLDEPRSPIANMPSLPASVIDAAASALDRGETHYTDRPGIPEFRAWVADHLRERYRVSVDPAEVTITCGSTEARFVCMTLLAAPGSSVLCPGDSSRIRGAAHLVGARIVDSIQDDISLLYIRPGDYRETSIELLQRAEATEVVDHLRSQFRQNISTVPPGAEPEARLARCHHQLFVRFDGRLAAGLDGWLGNGAASARWQASDHHLHDGRLAVGRAGMGEDTAMTLNANPNIPQEVRAVAADGTQLRYALMEMAREMDDVIALGRGDPDLDTPPHIVEAAKAAIRDGRANPTPVKGMDDLRAAIADHMRQVNGLPVGADNVMVTTGGQEGLFLAIQALIDPGDEILVPEPRYSSYDDAIQRAGGVMVAVPTKP